MDILCKIQWQLTNKKETKITSSELISFFSLAWFEFSSPIRWREEQVAPTADMSERKWFCSSIFSGRQPRLTSEDERHYSVELEFNRYHLRHILRWNEKRRKKRNVKRRKAIFLSFLRFARSSGIIWMTNMFAQAIALDHSRHIHSLGSPPNDSRTLPLLCAKRERKILRSDGNNKKCNNEKCFFAVEREQADCETSEEEQTRKFFWRIFPFCVGRRFRSLCAVRFHGVTSIDLSGTWSHVCAPSRAHTSVQRMRLQPLVTGGGGGPGMRGLACRDAIEQNK